MRFMTTWYMVIVAGFSSRLFGDPIEWVELEDYIGLGMIVLPLNGAARNPIRL
jgi:hypothetical protein